MKNWGKFSIKLFLFSWVFVIGSILFFGVSINQAEAQIFDRIASGLETVTRNLENPFAFFTLGIRMILIFIANLVAGLLYFAGIILDLSILIGIDNFHFFANSDFIESTWTIIRDLINVTFIFILLYISINLVIKGSNFQAKKLLGGVIAAALLINFSLFFVRVAIDISNILTIKLHDTAINNRSSVEIDIFSGRAIEQIGDYFQNSLASRLMSEIGLQKLWNLEDGADFKTIATVLGINNDLGNLEIVINIILMLTIASLFITIGVMFTIRIISLVIILITSAFGLTTYFLNFGQTASNHNKWTEHLVYNLVFPPVFFIFMIIIFQFFERTPSLDTAFLGAISSPKDTAKLLLDYMFVIGLLFAAIIYTNKAGKWGSGKAIKIGTSATFGVAGLIGRHTVGRAARDFADANPQLNSSYEGRLILGAANKLGGFSFNVGNIEALNKKAPNIDKSGAGGYNKFRDDEKKKYEEEIKVVATLTPEEQKRVDALNKELFEKNKELEDSKIEKKLPLLRKYRENVAKIADLQELIRARGTSAKEINKANKQITLLADALKDVTSDLIDVDSAYDVPAWTNMATVLNPGAIRANLTTIKTNLDALNIDLKDYRNDIKNIKDQIKPITKTAVEARVDEYIDSNQPVAAMKSNARDLAIAETLRKRYEKKG